MRFEMDSLEYRYKNHIKDYGMESLFDTRSLQEFLKALAQSFGCTFLLTDRHGEESVSSGESPVAIPNVVEQPGEKIRVAGRTVAHLYMTDIPQGREEDAERLLEALSNQLTMMGEKAYQHSVTSLYADELEKRLGKEQYHVKLGEKEDALTGVLCGTYFENRMNIIDRSGVVPVAIVDININDWKVTNDHYGDEESNRLISVVAGIIKQQAKPEYVIGRIGGDSFLVLIPMVQDGEIELFIQNVQEICLAYTDDKIAPSVACGAEIKYNIEQKLSDLLSDAEYMMFQNKMEIKNTESYKKRLEQTIIR